MGGGPMARCEAARGAAPGGRLRGWRGPRLERPEQRSRGSQDQEDPRPRLCADRRLRALHLPEDVPRPLAALQAPVKQVRPRLTRRKRLHRSLQTKRVIILEYGRSSTRWWHKLTL